jgi:hypothetical protein
MPECARRNRLRSQWIEWLEQAEHWIALPAAILYLLAIAGYWEITEHVFGITLAICVIARLGLRIARMLVIHQEPGPC